MVVFHIWTYILRDDMQWLGTYIRIVVSQYKQITFRKEKKANFHNRSFIKNAQIYSIILLIPQNNITTMQYSWISAQMLL